MSTRTLHLNLFVYPGGHHEAAWRHHHTDPDRLLDIRFYQDLARRAEAAAFDAVFFADGPSLADNVRYASRFRLEPFTWLSAIAAATERIGLIATASTTYTEPYNLARLFASLDHLSGGRAGWNIVTTGAPQAAGNFGLDEHPVHAERYDRAHEFVDVVTKLWDSWEDEALVVDQQAGVFADTDRIHEINHTGRHLKVRGPLNLPRSPQGRPVHVQAGSSEDGRAFAAAYAEAVFTAHQTLRSAQEFYADLKKRAAALGRDPDQVVVLPGISPFIGSTEAEALALHREFDELTQPEYSLHLLQRLLGLELSADELDGPVPRRLIETRGERGNGSRFQLVLDIIDREQPTVRQLLHRLAGARGHRVVAGTPEQVADRIQEWFEHGAADGFNIMPPYLSGGFDLFADQVVPILRARGLFRTAYEGTTLREHYGLPRPAAVRPAGGSGPSPAARFDPRASTRVRHPVP
ncbi:putative monooxygenase YxeK [Streptomyces ambofaciens ATCC 23877]|uniref:Putative monooxygenase YxeK n=1 Tax=Streptomyces ambofaciens (strain ATCC 23877 / 3486 / DSM 40053 / JCM 4204 / NBRC 12836 / NRRL B-2516) TaxID=278992 RepID=A3KIW8_STRA7|nr:LLM class flavin-dependent oxidoreductase [Streptomyces ambofaciens]AKZ53792.1 putative monooxygenase YxeK [Streptomyces ambofaciens ATCC 23877]CAJ89652.1 putative nitrilotriacetate monooxygenase (EC 1.14.13.-) component A [Streptomyces ambofaciens ATCC 23877]